MGRKQWTSVMMMFLYSILLVVLLILVILGARQYNFSLQSKQQHSQRRLPLSYLQSQAAGFEGAEQIVLTQGPEGAMLCLRESDNDYETRIYACGGNLRSEFSLQSSPVDPENSQIICAVEGFSLTRQGSLICIEANGCLGYIRCGGNDHG